MAVATGVVTAAAVDAATAVRLVDADMAAVRFIEAAAAAAVLSTGRAEAVAGAAAVVFGSDPSESVSR